MKAKRIGNLVKRMLSIGLALIMVLTAVFSGIGTGLLEKAGLGVDEVYAKEIGKKNEQACDECKAVNKGTAPAGYTDVLGNKAVYRGGTATSGLQTGQSFDTDPDTFASPLPYGDTYVDVSMLRWTDSATYIIDIPKDSPFQWVAVTDEGAALKDANGKTPEADPMGLKKGISEWAGQSLSSVIAYVGPLKGFHDNFTDAASGTGYTNEITAAKYGVPYLYKITYPGAVTLPTGVRGNLVITVSQVDIETAFTVDEEHPRTLTAKDNSTYEYEEGIVAVQSGNDMATSTAFVDKEGNYIVQDLGRALTADQVRAKLTAAGVANQNNITASSQDKYTRGATGVHVDLDINVTDADGKGIDGTISYAAMDLDLPSYQNVWGRKSIGDDRLEFSEGLEIISGSQSYALVPVYDHADETSVATGWVPVGPFDEPRDSPLDISGGSGTHADGVNFRSTSLINFRDSDGKWDNVPFYVSGTATEASQKEMRAYPNGNPWARDYDALDKGGQLTRPYLDMKPGWSVKASTGASTAQEALDLLDDASWATERGDANTYDTGFAVLLDAKSSKLRWSGSTSSTGTVITNLFDSKLFTYIEQTHGTGGGIYLESYKINDECKPAAKEGVVTMGRGADATVTAVPEEGYRIKRFLIGGKGLSSPKEYKLDDLGLTPGTPKTFEDEGITFELNADGTVDVTFTNIQDPRHIHVDFDADYYFYKIWKGDENPTKLNMTAVPYAYIFTDVTLPVPTGVDTEGHAIYTETHFSIDGTEYTAEDGTKYVLNANNTLETVAKDASGKPRVTLPQVLEGNNFVGNDGKEYPVTVKFGVNFAMGDGTTEASVKKTFTVDDTTDYTGALTPTDTSDDYVTVLDENNNISNGNIVWKIKYPAEGVESLGWPALPIETEPDKHNTNHVERNYWFATEEAPGWSKEHYDNSKAEAPGVVPEITGKHAGYYNNHVWAAASIKDYTAATKMIQEENKSKNVYMSVFSKDANTNKDTYGGEVSNIPAVVVKAVKTWEDFENEYNTRKAIWLHIDAKVGNVTTEDILPPQMLEIGTARTQSVIWGDKEAYETNQDGVKIIKDLSQIPLKDEEGRRVTYTHKADGSYPASNGITYWLNELVKVDSNGTDIEYIIRETLDAAGDESVEKDDPDAGLIGYTAEKDEISAGKGGQTEIGEGNNKANVLTYKGELKNELELVEITATKVWDDAENQDGYREDVTFVLDGLNGDLPNGQEKKAEVKAEDESTWEVKWFGLPKYEGGSIIDYNVLEEDLSDYYAASLASNVEEDGDVTVTISNIHVPETASVSVFKVWDDADNQDDLRKEAAKVILEGKTESESQYKSVVNQDGEGITQGLVPTEDGLVITWLNLPVNRNGEKITYKVSENISGLGGYYTDPTYVEEEFTLTDGENKEVTITNKETPEVTDITVTKEWDDMDDHDGIRPDSVRVVLTITYQDAVEKTKEVDKQVTVDGEKFDVKISPEGTEYFVKDEVYYAADDVTGIDKDVTEYRELTPFNPQESDEVMLTGKTVEIDEAIYPVQVTAEDKEYYVVEADGEKKYFDLDGNPLDAEDDGFNPTEGDEYVEEPAVVVIDEEEYEIRITSDGQTYYQKEDGKYYATGFFMEEEEELIPFAPSEEDETVKIEAKDEPDYEEKTETLKEITLSEDNEWTETVKDLDVNTPVGKKIVYSVEEADVPEGYEATVKSTEPGKYTITNKHEVIINPPVGEPEETEDYKGKPQTSPVIQFTPDPDTLGPGGTENKIERVTLVDENGKEVDEVTVPGEGTYVLNDDGTITFTPEPEFVGKTSGVKVRGYDSNGLSADTTYTPTVKHKVKYVDPLNPEEEQVVDGPRDCKTPDASDDKTTYEGEPGSESKNHPGYRFDGWDEEEVDDPDHPGDKITVRTAKYTPMYKIVYDPNGGTGEMPDNDYAADDPKKPFDKNTFTREGYDFIGFKAYITDPTTGKETPILDKNGEPLIFDTPEDMAEYFKDMPGGTKIRMEAQWKKQIWVTYVDEDGNTIYMEKENFPKDGEEPEGPPEPKKPGYVFQGWDRTVDEEGNITYVAKWRPESYTIKYDANGGTGEMSDQKFTGEDSEAESKSNEFTRPGYSFQGFIAKYPDGSTVNDENGNPIVFKNPDDFMEYLKEQGDGGEITLVAQWKKLPHVTYIDPATGRIIQVETDFLDANTEPPAPKDPTRTGYKFAGWDRVVDSEGNVVYYAKWVPASETKSNSVRTGDEANIWLWIGIIAAAAIVALAFTVARTRKGKE